ncbi:DUF4129 domain-containing protein [Maricaulis sp.]|uniref:DUF4129 domain-containing protein n=1 Tax=Maricaulis sp. TaxID=1486257 RepID=UPI0025BEF6EA|nr:DUF4129 domain-containing protein [Maricaulis sp.]
MASSPRPDPASRTVSVLRPWLWLVMAVILTIALVMVWQAVDGSTTDAVAPAPEDYSEFAQSRGLQAGLDHLDAETDWREMADLPEAASDANRPSWRANLTAIRLTIWTLVTVAVLVLAYIVYLAIRHGAGLRVDTRAPASSGDRRAARGPGTAAQDLPVLGLHEIARLTDAATALGALQRLVLVAAAEATGSILRRSETAREALRRLPRDWAHYERVARLVQIAEQVRYAGRSIEQDGVDSLIADARLVLEAKAVRT